MPFLAIGSAPPPPFPCTDLTGVVYHAVVRFASCYFACTNALPLVDFSASRCLFYTTCPRSSPVILPSLRHLLRGFYVMSSKLFCPYEDLRRLTCRHTCPLQPSSTLDAGIVVGISVNRRFRYSCDVRSPRTLPHGPSI